MLFSETLESFRILLMTPGEGRGGEGRGGEGVSTIYAGTGCAIFRVHFFEQKMNF